MLRALSIAAAASVAARLVNVTIDDYYGDERTGAVPLYDSAHGWNVAVGGCPDCGAKADPAQVYNHTWHGQEVLPGQIPANISFAFEGTAVWIFCTLADFVAVGNDVWDTRLAFYLDDGGEPVGQFLHEPANAGGFIYHSVVYSNETLQSGNHTMIVSNWATKDRVSYVQFDYVIYTMNVPDDDPAAPAGAPARTDTQAGAPAPTLDGGSTGGTAAPTRANAPAVAAAAGAGGVLALLLVCGCAWWYIVRRRRATVRQDRVKPASEPALVSAGLRSRPFTSPTEVSSHSSSAESANLLVEMARMRAELETIRYTLEPPRYNPAEVISPHSSDVDDIHQAQNRVAI